MYLDNSSVLCW